jgi:hypothetical protein
MSNRLSFACPSCGVRLRAKIRLVGHSRNCPSCDHAFVVPPSAPPESEPMLVADDEDSPSGYAGSPPSRSYK